MAAGQQKLRSKKGHERRVNGTIYTVLTVMSIVWLVPFVFLVLQSFRSYKLEKGGMVDYLLPKPFSLDNYAFLFEGSNFFSWLGRALLVGLIVAAVSAVLIHAAGQAAGQGRRRSAAGAFGADRQAACWRAFALVALTAALHGFVLAGSWVKVLLSLLLFVLAGWIMARVYLKQDSKLLRSIPGYVVEDRHEGLKKLCALALEFLALG